MKTSIIICTKDREEDIKKAIGSIANQMHLPDELIVVDAGTNPSLQSELKALIPDRIKFIYINSTPGLTRQRNIGIKHCSSDIIMFIDDDCILEPGYVKAVVKTFESDSSASIGAVIGNITNIEPEKFSMMARINKFISRCMTKIFLLTELGDGSLKASGLTSYPYLSKKSHYVHSLGGNCMSFRRSLFKQIAFDERLDGYCCYEDLDIARQVIGTGYKIYYEADAKLAHYPSISARDAARAMAEMRICNHYYLFCKHPKRPTIGTVAFAWSLCGLIILYLFKGSKQESSGALSALKKIVLREDPRVIKLKNDSTSAAN